MMNITSLLGRAALSLAFLCAATSARAGAVDSLVSISPDPADTLVSKTFNAEFTFSGDVTYDSVYVKSGSVENKWSVSSSASSTVTVPVTEAYWSSETTAGFNMISVNLIGVKDSNGSLINYSSGTAGVVSTSFRYLATSKSATTYVGVDPDPYWMLAQDLANEEMPIPAILEFSDSVEISDAYAIVEYWGQNGRTLETQTIISDSLYGDWIPRTNYYGVYVYIPEPEADWDDIDHVSISLYDLTSYGEVVSLANPLVSYDTEFEDEYALTAKKLAKKAKGVQTIQGLWVSNNSNINAGSLKPGLYIVNGNKLYVK